MKGALRFRNHQTPNPPSQAGSLLGWPRIFDVHLCCNAVYWERAEKSDAALSGELSKAWTPGCAIWTPWFSSHSVVTCPDHSTCSDHTTPLLPAVPPRWPSSDPRPLRGAARLGPVLCGSSDEISRCQCSGKLLTPCLPFFRVILAMTGRKGLGGPNPAHQRKTLHSEAIHISRLERRERHGTEPGRSRLYWNLVTRSTSFRSARRPEAARMNNKGPRSGPGQVFTLGANDEDSCASTWTFQLFVVHLTTPGAHRFTCDRAPDRDAAHSADWSARTICAWEPRGAKCRPSISQSEASASARLGAERTNERLGADG